MTRNRTITWDDPAPGAAAGLQLSGLEYLPAVAAGNLPSPPIAQTMGMNPVEFGEGFAIFGAEPAEYHYNPIGVVHGGLAATLLDSAMSCAVHTTLAPGERYTTLELKVNFVGAITAETSNQASNEARPAAADALPRMAIASATPTTAPTWRAV